MPWSYNRIIKAIDRGRQIKKFVLIIVCLLFKFQARCFSPFLEFTTIKKCLATGKLGYYSRFLQPINLLRVSIPDVLQIRFANTKLFWNEIVKHFWEFIFIPYCNRNSENEKSSLEVNDDRYILHVCTKNSGQLNYP